MNASSLLTRRSLPALLVVMASLGCSGDSPAVEADSAPDARVGTETISLLGKLEVTGLPIHDVWAYTDPVTDSEYALLCASTAGLKVIDISDRSNPKEVGSITEGITATDVKTWKSYAYTIGEGLGVTGVIVDLVDPTAPTKVGTFANSHNLYISDSGYMFAAAPGLRIYDLNPDPLRPVEVYSDTDCQGHDVAIIGERLYDFAGDCGTRIFDIADPSNPTLLGTVVDRSFSHHSGWPSADGRYLFICDELASPIQDDITVWDLRDMASPVKVASYRDPDAYVHNLYVLGNYAYVSYYRAGFRVFDVADPAEIALIDEFDTDPNISGPGFGGNFGVAPFQSDGAILASDESSGLYIFAFDGNE